jgi:hypothetical protein
VEESYKEYLSRKLELKSLFGLIIDHLSLESLQRVRSSETFDEIEPELHGFKLWQLVEKLHTAGDDNEEEVWRQDRVLSNYYGCRMRADESLIDFFHRFKENIDNMDSAGVEPPEEKLQTIQFINNLDPSRIAEFKATIRNLSKLGVAVPTTLVDALSRANTYVVKNTVVVEDETSTQTDRLSPTSTTDLIAHAKSILASWNC